MSLLIGYLADVDFSSEGFRFLGSLRFDFVGAFKLLSPDTIRAQITTVPPLKKIEEDNFYPYLSIAFVLFESITPTFHFKSTGLHCLTRKDNLIPFVMKDGGRKCSPVDKIEITSLANSNISIDGELYKADSVFGEVIQKISGFEITEDPELTSGNKRKGSLIEDCDSLQGKIFRIA